VAGSVTVGSTVMMLPLDLESQGVTMMVRGIPPAAEVTNGPFWMGNRTTAMRMVGC
jgi:hypothetical protein